MRSKKANTSQALLAAAAVAAAAAGATEQTEAERDHHAVLTQAADDLGATVSKEISEHWGKLTGIKGEAANMLYQLAVHLLVQRAL